ncbi:MAG TPA: bifunctional diaminohydroxyphosphoribosylaminopyrimidine deaminase/5-amino-6-(5-phosphoribosylamino)uracil reductase RibD [Acidimicrobiales bacterium]
MRFTVGEEKAMRRAMVLAAGVRGTTSPNPWVGAVIVPGGYEGATSPPGGPHAEAIALAAAGMRARGATLVSTLEPCCHQGRTAPCTDAILAAGVRRVVVGVEDPDPQVRGAGLQVLREAGVDVVVGVCADDVKAQLAPYLKHRETGRPYVVLKLAVTMDGRTAAPDGSSRWITGEAARADAHRLRSECDAVVVGAGTVRADDPELTVRAVATDRQPLRVVLGKAGVDAKVQPAVELWGEPGEVLDELGRLGVLSAIVEGGATVAGAFHRAGVVDRYVFYVAPALLGGDDGRPVLAGPGVATMAEAWRGRIVGVEQMGDDVRIDVLPARA